MLLDKNGIIKRLAAADAAASREVSFLKSLEFPSLSDYQTHIRRYVLFKFLLDDEEGIETKDLNELAALSIQKAGRLNPNEPALLDMSKHCGATSSAMTKKVLLYMRLSEDFEIDLSKINTADIVDTNSLGEIIFQMRQS